MRALDRKMGKHLGFTSRLLQGESRLRFDHVLEILAALGEEPGDFFQEIALRLQRVSPDREAGSGDFDEHYMKLVDLLTERAIAAGLVSEDEVQETGEERPSSTGAVRHRRRQ